MQSKHGTTDGRHHGSQAEDKDFEIRDVVARETYTLFLVAHRQQQHAELATHDVSGQENRAEQQQAIHKVQDVFG